MWTIHLCICFSFFNLACDIWSKILSGASRENNRLLSGDFSNNLVHLNPAAPARSRSSASTFECNAYISKSNQQLTHRIKSPPYFFSFPIIRYTWMYITIQNKISVTTCFIAASTSISHSSEHLDQHRAPQDEVQDKAAMLKNIDVLIQINDRWQHLFKTHKLDLPTNHFIHNQRTNRYRSDIWSCPDDHSSVSCKTAATGPAA